MLTLFILISLLTHNVLMFLRGKYRQLGKHAYLDFQKWLSVERLIMTKHIFGDLGD